MVQQRRSDGATERRRGGLAPLSRGWRRACLVALAVSLLGGAGCEGDRPAGSAPEVWSTKAQSILPAPESVPHLNAAHGRPTADSVAARAAAIDVLEEASESTNPLVLATTIEALEAAPEHAEPAVRLGLGSPNRGVRFAATMMVGKLRMSQLAHVVEPLLDDSSGSVRAAAIYALRRCGRPVDLNPLAMLIRSSDPEVKGNTALVLGELGDPSAISMLREAAHDRSPRVSAERARIVNLQIAEAMVRLGEESELEVIRAALFAPDEQAEIKALACLLCGDLGDEAYTAPLLDKALRTGREQESPEVRMAAVQALARIDPARAPAQVPLEYAAADRFELRQQAAVTMGWIRDPSLLPALEAMLDDANALVQVAAAGAVLRITLPPGTGARIDTNVDDR